jgi:hypothetical protein
MKHDIPFAALAQNCQIIAMYFYLLIAILFVKISSLTRAQREIFHLKFSKYFKQIKYIFLNVIVSGKKFDIQV